MSCTWSRSSSGGTLTVFLFQDFCHQTIYFRWIHSILAWLIVRIRAPWRRLSHPSSWLSKSRKKWWLKRCSFGGLWTWCWVWFRVAFFSSCSGKTLCSWQWSWRIGVISWFFAPKSTALDEMSWTSCPGNTALISLRSASLLCSESSKRHFPQDHRFH